MSFRTKHWFRWSACILITLLLIGVIWALRMDFYWSDQRYLRRLEKAGALGEVMYAETGKGSIRAVVSGHADGIPLVFIHGTPGSSRDYRRYLSDDSLRLVFRMVAVDRPGYGKSMYGKPHTSIAEQADLIAGVLPDSALVAGHSFGGPVASALAMRHPEKVKALVLLAPAVSPGDEQHFFFNGLMQRKGWQWMLSGAYRVAIAEKLNHVQALEELLPGWAGIRTPVTVLHGRADRIVPVANAAFLRERLINVPSLDIETPEDMRHMMIWTDYDQVRELLLNQLKYFPERER